MSGAAAAASTTGRWLAPEVVQTSAMDCGPAALKCLLEGHGIPVSYGRLREACQTDVDGTSIDALEAVAAPLGLRASQEMIPADHLPLAESAALPAIVVVRQDDGAVHFVVVWRRVGNRLQVMDPACGRRWLRPAELDRTLLRHQHSVPAAGWREWAGSDEFQAPLQRRLADLGIRGGDADALLALASLDAGWFGLGTLDAAVRLAASLVRSGGVARGRGARRLVHTLYQRTHASPDDIHGSIPTAYWSAMPDPDSARHGELRLTLRGAVLLKVAGRWQQPAPNVNLPAAAAGGQADSAVPTGADVRTGSRDSTGVCAPAHPADEVATAEAPAPLSPELAAALRERPEHPLRSIWALLRQDGLLAPAALLGAMALAAATLVVQTLLLRGVVDISAQLGSAPQRLVALALLLAFGALLLGLELPIASQSMRLGRHLELRLRMALLDKLPRLNDRYFQSRSVSDMADRNHGIPQVRTVPMLGLNFLQSTTEALLTLGAIAWVAPHAAGLAALIVAAAIGVPTLLQPLLNERDLRLRSHTSALNGFYLDALQGLVPVRSHRAERAVRRQHEGLLVDWARSSRRMVVAAMAVGGAQQLVCTALAAGLLWQHFGRGAPVGGVDLLLVYWVLKLPSIGQGIGALARQYPAQRHALLRLLEPLAAPDELPAGSGSAAEAATGAPAPGVAPAAAVAPVAIGAAAADAAQAGQASAAALAIDGGRVVAGGHTLLQGLQLQIRPGEHVAIVGASGAGKSTLLGLLLGWHRLEGGTLRVDGQPLDAERQQTLRAATAWVDPAVQLWNRPLLDNLVYASAEAGDGQALARIGPALQAAQLQPVLPQLPQGLQTPLGEGGARLSGGQGQRVRLARAMLQTGVRLVLLDEPFRGLDRGQRAQLMAESRRWWQQQTLLCVTHDVSQTQGFDRVLVVDEGRIVEDGTPAELARHDTRYAALLQAEQALRHGLWQGARWRRLTLSDGRLADEAPGPSPRPGTGTGPDTRPAP